MRDIDLIGAIVYEFVMLGKTMIALLFQNPVLFIVWTLAFLISLGFHEFSHALAGTWLGDTTAKRMGRLTLNPAAHVDPMGLGALLLIGFGWGKPVPFNPYNLKWSRWGPAAVAGAGPLSNLFLALVTLALFAVIAPNLGPGNLLVIFLALMVQINVSLMVFNLIPLPPLDGSKALLSALAHPKYASIRQMIEVQGPTLLFMIIIADAFLNLGIFSRLFTLALGFLSRIVPGAGLL
jgi:Zn-dependent protease